MDERLQKDVKRLRQDYPNVEVAEQPDGSVHVRVSGFALPDWWTPSQTRVLLVIGKDYPQSRPTFYVGADIHLHANGQPPGGSGQAEVAGEQWMSLCWQAPWDPNRETIWRLVKLVERRFDLHD